MEKTAKSKELNSNSSSIKLTWSKGEKAPCGTTKSYSAAMDGGTLYVRMLDHKIYAYTISTLSWSQIPNGPTNDCPSVIINNLLTLVGGYHNEAITNQLFSLTREGSGRIWTEEFPPMPTERWGSSALCIEKALIVAGGCNTSTLRAVEVLNTETLQWSTAVGLPQALSHAPAAICGDQVYILGKSSMYMCSLRTLIQSSKSFLANLRKKLDTGAWTTLAAPPVSWTTYVSIHGRLLAIGGKDSRKQPTTAIHMYNPTANSWAVVSHMETPRCECIAAVLSNNQLMVVGGYTVNSYKTDSVELATIK